MNFSSISKKAKEYNCVIGLDLAHAAGNVKLFLHDWDIDFAVWCSYKYLNSGPGSVGGVFIHHIHHNGGECEYDITNINNTSNVVGELYILYPGVSAHSF